LLDRLLQSKLNDFFVKVIINTMTKSELAYKACLSELERRIKLYTEKLKDVDEATFSESKSSAGDKFETGRAMMQRERENTKVQLIKLKGQLHELKSISVNDDGKVGLGKLVITSLGDFFVGVALGKLKSEELEFMAVSAEAPLIRNMMGLGKGEVFEFNGRKGTVIAI